MMDFTFKLKPSIAGLSLTAIVIFAYGIRILHGIGGMGNDSWWYLLLARNTVRGVHGFVECLPENRHFYENLYAYIVGLLSGQDETPSHLYFTARQLSAIMGSLCCLPAYWLGRKYFSSFVGLASSGFVAVLPQLVRSSAFVLTESTFVFFDLTALCLVLASIEKRNSWLSFLAGLIWGLACLTRANGLISLLLIMIFIFIQHRNNCFNACKTIFLPLIAAWLLLYIPYAIYLSHDYGKLVLTPKSSAGQISIRGTYIGQPVHAAGSDLDEAEFAKNKGKAPDSLLSYYLNYPKTAIRVTVLNLRRGHFDDTLKGYDLPILLIAFATIGLFITLRFNRWNSFHTVATIWIVGLYFFNAAFLIMLQRFYESSYVLLAVLAGYGLVHSLLIFGGNKTLSPKALFLMVTTYLVTCIPVIAETTGLQVIPDIADALPMFTGAKSSNLRLVVSKMPAKTALLMGVSTCSSLATDSYSLEGKSRWVQAMKLSKPELLQSKPNETKSEYEKLFPGTRIESIDDKSGIFRLDWNP